MFKFVSARRLIRWFSCRKKRGGPGSYLCDEKDFGEKVPRTVRLAFKMRDEAVICNGKSYFQEMCYGFVTLNAVQDRNGDELRCFVECTLSLV